MADKTKIDWADSSWNPITGCEHGCTYCYAQAMTNRYKCKGYPLLENGDYAVAYKDYQIALKKYPECGQLFVLDKPLYMRTKDGELKKAPYPFGFKPTLHRYRLDNYKNKKGRTIFVVSMGDMFGEWVPDSWIEEVFAACAAAPQHRYLFLTKNPKRYSKMPPVPENIKNNMWFGTTITQNSDVNLRADALLTFRLKTGCNTFLSVEPLLDRILPWEIEYMIPAVQWVIIGAESGHRKEKVIPEMKWIADIYVRSKTRGLSVFMKESVHDIMGEGFVQQFSWGDK